MSGFSSNPHGPSQKGLFSAAEIRVLMEAEYKRSLRYEYPLALFLIEIDRLESLHDLYGLDSKLRIQRAVATLVHSGTRASDVLGYRHDDRLLALFPHATREASAVLARRLITGCHEIRFQGEGRSLRATLSIGTAQRGDEGDLDLLIRSAEEALRHAVDAGGDRWMEFERLPRPAAALPVTRVVPRGVPPPVPPAPAPAPDPVPPPPAPRAAALPSLRELAGKTLEEKVRSLLRLMDPGSRGSSLEEDVVHTIRRTIAEVRGGPLTQEETEREIEVLERRVVRLREMLEASEEELDRMVQEKSVEPGIASIYRTVQGLDPHSVNFQKKRELLGVIYQANVELLRRLKEQQAG